ncbi:MAG: glycoside hydrolase family 15 protein [Frankiales bacterium]|nr:glycoside hydrolase family 15 protein [Frankiales bacterium]
MRPSEPGLRIEDHAVIGDTHTMALVGLDGSIDWLCLPRFDSAACFTALLGTEDNGRWQVCPRGLADGVVLRTTQRYRGPSLVLETEFETATGVVRVVDAMPVRDVHADVVRRVEGVRGEVEMAMRWTIRFGYGAATPWVRRATDERGEQVLLAVAGPDAVVLRGDVLPQADKRGTDKAHHAYFTVREGEAVDLSMQWFPSHEPVPHAHDVQESLRLTEEHWTQWAARSTYSGPHPELVERSLITLKAMTYAPTGGIVAAPTTSLPEQIGGPRNWDYRFCWLRDATLVLHALLSCGYTAEAESWQHWLLRAIAGSPEELQIVYGVAGERALPELELGHLPGYEGSRPVRIGNGASTQFQLDVYGEVLSALHAAMASGIDGDEMSWPLVRAVLAHLEQVMDRPDAGLWEVRGEQRHFTHSRVMVWVAFDRAVRMVEEFGLEGPVERWRELRDQVHAEVCERGWNDDVRAFTQYYGGAGLDAALLVVPSVGFLPGDDPRVRATVDAVCTALRRGPLVDRYETTEEVDGLPPGEGSFLTCSYWLVTALSLCGRRDEAHALFDELAGLANHVGLFAEEYDGVTQRMTGNFPQAFSHLALVEAAMTLAHGSTPGHGGTSPIDGRPTQGSTE